MKNLHHFANEKMTVRRRSWGFSLHHHHHHTRTHTYYPLKIKQFAKEGNLITLCLLHVANLPYLVGLLAMLRPDESRRKNSVE